MSRLRQLINITHKHGIAIAERIRHTKDARLIKKLFGWKRGLENLNKQRHKELFDLEHPKPRFISMYDTIIPFLIPKSPEAVAGYVDGKWPTFNECLKRFPHAKHLSIAVFARDNADCLDVEAGNAEPWQVPEWVRRQKAAGKNRPCIYASLSVMPEILHALLNHGIARSSVRLWVADWTHIPHIPFGFDACQYTDRMFGLNLDASLCHGDFL